jgi:hypothetical protein
MIAITSYGMKKSLLIMNNELEKMWKEMAVA